MPVALTSLLLHVGADTRDAESGLGRVNEHVGRMGGLIGGTAATFTGGMALIGGAVLGAVGTVRSFIDAANESTIQSTQLNAVLASTKGVAGLSRDAIDKLTDRLSFMSGIDDEVVTSAESMLLTFTNIGKDVFPHAAEAVLNLSEKFGGVQQAAVQVGKALQDPEKGLLALTRVGVSFSAQEKQQIKDFIATGQVAKAQGVILKELDIQFGGLAKSMGQTLPGAMGVFKTQLGNVKEAIGLALGEPIRALLVDRINPLLHTIADNLPAALEALGTKLNTLKTAIQGFAANFKPLLDNTKTFRQELANLAKEIPSGIGKAFDTFTKNLPQIGSTISQMLTFFQPLVQIVDQISSTFKPLTESVLPDFLSQFKGIKVTLLDVETFLNNLVQGALQKFSDIWVSLGPALAEAAPHIVNMADGFGQMVQALTPLLGLLNPVFKLFMDMLPVLAPLIPTLTAIADQIQGALIRNLAVVVPAIVNLVNVFEDGLAPILKDIIPVVQQVAGVLGDVFTTVLDTLGPLIATVADSLSQQLGPIMKQLEPIIHEVVDAVGSWISQLAEVLMPLIVAVGGLLQKILPPAFEIIGKGLHFLLDVFQFVWPTIHAIVDVAINAIRNVIKIVTAAISGDWGAVWNGILNLVKGIFGGIFNVIGTFMNSIWQKIKEVGGFILDAILKPFQIARDTIGSIYKALANFGIDAINNFVIASLNSFIGKVATAIDWITDKLHAGKPLEAFEHSAIGSIPRFATGGTMGHSGLALVGENGPELAYLPGGTHIVPGGGGTGMTDASNPLQGIFDAIGDWFTKGASWLVDQTFTRLGVGNGDIGPLGNIKDTLREAAVKFIDNILGAAGGDIGEALKSPGYHWWTGHIIQAYHDPRNPAHGGIDFHASYHTPLVALLGGTVYRGDYRPWGGELDLWANLPGYGRGLENYTHLDYILPQYTKPGAFVPSGAVIGLSGGQPSGGLHPAHGFSGGPHLHYNWFVNRPWAHDDLNPTPFIDSLRGGPRRGFAEGGWITEPVAGIGMRTGTTYTFGENESEFVTPRSRMGSGPGTVIHVYAGAAESDQQLASKIAREFYWQQVVRGNN